MHCKKCGAALTGDGSFCPTCGKKVPRKSKRPIGPIRLVLQLASFVLFLALLASLLGTVLLADVRLLTSSGGIETILHQLIAPDDRPASDPIGAAVGAVGVVVRRDSQDVYIYTVDEDGNIIDENGNIIGNVNDPGSIQLPEGVELPEDLQIPTDALADSNALAEYIHEMAQQLLGEDIPITVDQVLSFIVESNVMEFVADKASTLVEDVLSGDLGSDPIITTEELVQLVEDNRAVIEKHFNVEITDEMAEEISTQIHENIDDEALNQSLRDTVNETMSQPVPGMEDMTVSDLLAKINVFTQTQFIIGAVIICLLMMGLMMALNYYNLPKGLRWNADACIWVGILLSTPLLVLQFAPSVLTNLLPETAEVLSLAGGAIQVIAPLHYGLLALGITMFIGSVVWKMMTKKR